jgi:hypothetical protein
MASHFGPHGEVTNWQSKEQFFMTMVVVVGVSFVAGFGRKKRPVCAGRISLHMRPQDCDSFYR